MVNILLACVYFINKAHFEGIKTFKDALYYSITVTSSLGAGDITPKSHAGKMLTLLHSFVVFISISNFVVFDSKNMFLFTLLNMLLICMFSTAYVAYDKINKVDNSIMDYIYHTVSTHTSIGLCNLKETKIGIKALTSTHLILMFSLLYTFSRSGLFSTVALPLLGEIY